MKISDIFDVSYGINLELNKCDITSDRDGINFVSRTSQNNGVVAKVKRIAGKEPQPAGVLTCAGGGSVLSTFVQTEPFYSGRDLYILKPKKYMSLNEKLFYAMCIKENAYRYNYGRQANKTLRDIDIPDKVPSWVYDIDIDYDILKSNVDKNLNINLDTQSWKEFKVGDIMQCSLSKPIHKESLNASLDGINYVTRTINNNGVEFKTNFNNLEFIIEGNCITIGAEGLQAFYQKNSFITGNKVNIIRNDKLNKFNSLFLCTVLNETIKGKFNYGRAVVLSKLKELVIKLPIDDEENPDWLFMENYIKSLPYSDKI